MHYPITLSLQLSRGFAFRRRGKKKEKKRWWRGMKKVHHCIQESSEERRWTVLPRIQLPPFESCISSLFPSFRPYGINSSASRKEVADRGGPTPPSSLLRAITPRFSRDPRWSSRRQFITSRWATLRALPPSYSSSRTELRIILWSLPIRNDHLLRNFFFNRRVRLARKRVTS